MFYSLYEEVITEDGNDAHTLSKGARKQRASFDNVVAVARELSALEPSRWPLKKGELSNVWLVEVDADFSMDGEHTRRSLHFSGASEDLLCKLFRTLGFKVAE